MLRIFHERGCAYTRNSSSSHTNQNAGNYGWPPGVTVVIQITPSVRRRGRH